MTLRPLNFRKIAKRLIELGYHPVRQSGSHVIFKHKDGRIIVVPNHPGEKIGRGLLRKTFYGEDLFRLGIYLSYFLPSINNLLVIF